MTPSFLGFFGGMFALYGIYCFFSPGALAEIAGVVATTPTGATELRAMYGGLQLAFGVLLLAAIVREALVGPALIALGVLGAGLLGARLLGAALEGGWSQYTGMAFVLEAAMIVGSVTLLRSAPKTVA